MIVTEPRTLNPLLVEPQTKSHRYETSNPKPQTWKQLAYDYGKAKGLVYAHSPEDDLGPHDERPAQNSTPKTQNLESETRKMKTEIRKTKTVTQKNEERNLNAETQHPRPKPRNPKPQNRKTKPHGEDVVHKDWYFVAQQPAPATHLAHPSARATLRIVQVDVPRLSRYC